MCGLYQHSPQRGACLEVYTEGRLSVIVTRAELPNRQGSLWTSGPVGSVGLTEHARGEKTDQTARRENGTLECLSDPTLFVVISRLTISSRPSNPLSACLLSLRFGFW